MCNEKIDQDRTYIVLGDQYRVGCLLGPDAFFDDTRFDIYVDQLIRNVAPKAYWEDYCTATALCAAKGSPVLVLLSTIAIGRKGASDARYIEGRVASGSYPAQIIDVTEIGDHVRRIIDLQRVLLTRGVK
jgi:hypothetical protein